MQKRVAVATRAAVVAAVLTAFVVATAFAGAALRPTGLTAPAKVLDRTLVCSTGEGGPMVGGGPKTAMNPGGLGLERQFTGGHTSRVAVGTTSAYVDRQYCAPTANRVALSRKGLPGPPTAGGVTCPLGRVLVRLRYTYTPTNAEPPPWKYTVLGRLTSAFLAVRSYKTLEPLAFARLTAGGRTFQLYTASSCIS
jgi:hypothetical protein